MTTDLEKKLREMLRAKADAHVPSLRPPGSISMRVRIATARRLLFAMTPIVVALFIGTTVVSMLTPNERAFAALTVRQSSQAKEDTGINHTHARSGPAITLSNVKEHVECMRGHGFSLPDPIPTPDGWQVIVEESEPLPSESPDVNVRRRWAEAVFVDCRMLDATDDLVLGARTREQIERLVACVRSEGFRLPRPVESRPGEFVFDLDATSPAWGSKSWYRTVFVTCGLWRLAP